MVEPVNKKRERKPLLGNAVMSSLPEIKCTSRFLVKLFFVVFQVIAKRDSNVYKTLYKNFLQKQ